LNGLCANFITFIGKDGTDFTRSFELSVFIVGISAKDLNFLDEAIEAKFSVKIDSGLI